MNFKRNENNKNGAKIKAKKYKYDKENENVNLLKNKIAEPNLKDYGNNESLVLQPIQIFNLGHENESSSDVSVISKSKYEGISTPSEAAHYQSNFAK